MVSPQKVHRFKFITIFWLRTLSRTIIICPIIFFGQYSNREILIIFGYMSNTFNLEEISFFEKHLEYSYEYSDE